MDRHFGDSTRIQSCLDRWGAGELGAREELVAQSCRRLRQLSAKMLHGYPVVRRFEDTDDVLQSALMRLDRALGAVTPKTVSDFFALAALQIRRELVDLARRYKRRFVDSGQQRVGDSSEARLAKDFPDSTAGPFTIAQWTEFHERVSKLPTEERELFDLHFYGGLTLAETASQLGISERTAKRRWRDSRLSLHKALHGEGSSFSV